MSKEPPVTHGEIADLFNPERLEAHIRNKYIKRQGHPRLPLAILNYTNHTQFDNAWDNITMRCRGIIYNYETGDIVAVPFAKFFNYDTADREETFPENLPDFEPEITKKLDGSLGILWRWNEHWGIATRGSFASDQAKWATNWFEQNANLSFLPKMKHITPLFEVIYPENRVVVKYDQSGLTLIGCVDNTTGMELDHNELEYVGAKMRVPVVERINDKIEELSLLDNENEEGYVATWHHTDRPPFRVKIKFPTYFRLHRLLTGTSPKRIWEFLRDGKQLSELVDDVPEHFKQWVLDWGQRLTQRHSDLESAALKKYEAVGKFQPDRKTFALWATQPENRDCSAILFKMLDGKPHADLIWKLVKPMTENLGTFKSVDE